jgi:GNAT superfamily N-acetyltransferase
MMDEWMTTLRLRLTLEEFHRLPRHPAYKYEYLSGEAYLTPYPKHYHAVLPLPPPSAPEAPEAPADLVIRGVEETDLSNLEQVFRAAFARTQPLAGLAPEARAEAARKALQRTVSGGDGPWVRQASFVAVKAPEGGLIGSALVTLLPEGDPCDWDSYYWQGPPPADCVERHLGRPHLTWIFVAGLRAGQGTGTALLGAVTRALVGLGYRELFSTFLLGNESSTLWHWRNGFRLLPYPGSLRHISQRFRERRSAADGAPSSEGSHSVAGD